LLAKITLSSGILFAQEKARRHRVRVLIVDDDETFCQLLAEVLQNKGMQVVWTTDGIAGYDMSTRQVYDIFIVDVRMPLILGTELAEALKKDHPHAKIILVSAFADPTLLRLAKRIDVPLLSKPFSTTHLLEAVERVLGGSIKLAGSNSQDENGSDPSRCKQV
jgi:CheY-like chemotaxis protein